MAYKVKLTLLATAQIAETVSYISKILLEPETAGRWANTLQKEISSLDAMPARYPLIGEEPWRTNGIRKMPVKNFIVYYFIKEEEQTVWITAVVYGRRDQINALQNMSRSADISPKNNHDPNNI
jgi:toxin ParE1/3/4